jgi:glycerophosphoryl diester phosphodiesterase
VIGGAGPRPIVIAHRGGAAEAPENSIAAFERAIRLGYPGVEFDVRMTGDGVPVVVHDATIRLAPGGPGRAVAACDAAALPPHVPRLDAVLALPFGAMVLMVEVKPTDEDAALGAAAARAVVARGLAPRAVLASCSADVLRAAGRAAPGLALMGLLDRSSDEASFQDVGLAGWGVDVRLVSAGRVGRWRTTAPEVWTWTVADLGQARGALAAGVDGLITDIPGSVLDHLRDPGRAV